MLIDTHCHLSFADFDADRPLVIDRAVKAGLAAIIDVGSSVEGTLRAVKLASEYDIVFASIGVHPHEAASVTPAVIDEFRRLAKERKVVAVGEVGLDFYRNLSPRRAQEEAFKDFILLADELKLPLIVHSRQAGSDCIRMIKEGPRGARGVVHCFSGDRAFLKECLDIGFFVSFTCNLTFKKADDLREVAKYVPVERLLLETDAPYLAPQAQRGRRNESAFLTYLVDEWAAITALSANDIRRITTHNANELFGLFPEERSAIVYEIRDCLYLNITNRCTNSCGFCVRTGTDFVKGHNLTLEREPSAEEVIKAVGDPSRYREIVFCGYGEPTARLDVVKAVAGRMKQLGARVRLVTNGHGNLINGRDIVPELAGIVDKVSVSLNADNAERYMRICSPEFGKQSYEAVKDFIKACASSGIEAEATCLDLDGVDVKKCAGIASGLGARFRLRHYGVTG